MRPNPLIPTFTLAMSLLLAISKESNGDAPAKPCTKQRAGRQDAACGADHERPGGFAGGPFTPSRPPARPPFGRAGGEAPRTASPSAIVALRTLATDGVLIHHRTSANPPLGS